MRILNFLPIVLLVTLSCNKTAIEEPTESGLSDLNFTLPEGAGELYTGYFVNFFQDSNYRSECSENKEWSKGTQTRTVNIKFPVKNGCDYRIILELGKINAAGDALETVYYTNKNAEYGTPIPKEKLTGGDVSIKIKLYKTANAPADAPGEVQTQDYSNLKIDVTFDDGSDAEAGGGNGPANGRAPAPPANQQPTVQLTAYENTLKSIRLETHSGRTENLFDKVQGKKAFLVKFSWVDCDPCDRYHAKMKTDAQLQAIVNGGNCPVFTVLLPGRRGLEQYSPSSQYFKDPYRIGRELQTRLGSSFPYTAIINPKTGVIMERTGEEYGVVTRFKQMCQ